MATAAVQYQGRTLQHEVPRVYAPLLVPSRYKGAHGGRGSAKCLGRGVRVMRFDGSYAAVETVQVGDLLMGPDSTPRQVLATTCGYGPLYSVVQKTAEDYVVNDAHILVLQHFGEPFEDILLISAADYCCASELFKKTTCGLVNHEGWRPTAVDVEPLGDGEYFGFELDGDRLFLLADGTVTHNSHFFAELLIKRCLLKTTRAVCVREFQSSLEQSCKRLLEDKIDKFKLGNEFRVMNTHIETPGDGVIIFQGMKQQTAESIKSLEGFDVAWVEEAQSLSDRSLTMLRPTIRLEDSELWFSWNPKLKTDPVDVLLRSEEKPPGAVVIEANYRDNPWFPDVLRAEMEWDRGRDPEKYAHIWLGQYEKHAESRVFKNWRVEEFETPAGTMFLFGGDWGFSVDPTVLVRMWLKPPKTLYIDHEAYKIGCEIDAIPDLFDRLACGCEPPRPCPSKDEHGMARLWPIFADSARPETISYLQKHGYPKIQAATKGPNSVKEGVIFLQGYDIVIHPRCVHTIDEFTMFSYKLDAMTGLVTPILSDKKNHVIDSARYAVEKLRGPAKRGLTW